MKKIFFQKLIVCSLLFLFVFFIWRFVLRIAEDYKHYRLLKSEAVKLQEHLSNLEKEIVQLKKRKEKSFQEEELEREVRMKMGMKKEGEKVIMLIPPKVVSTTLPVITSSAQETSFFERLQRIWYNFLQNIQKVRRE